MAKGELEYSGKLLEAIRLKDEAVRNFNFVILVIAWVSLVMIQEHQKN